MYQELYKNLLEAEKRSGVYTVSGKAGAQWKFARRRIFDRLLIDKNIHGHRQPKLTCKKNRLKKWVLRFRSLGDRKKFSYRSGAQKILLVASQENQTTELALKTYLANLPGSQDVFLLKRDGKTTPNIKVTDALPISRVLGISISDLVYAIRKNIILPSPVRLILRYLLPKGAIGKIFQYLLCVGYFSAYDSVKRRSHKLLRDLAPEELIVICSYGLEPLIEAAKEEKIATCEVQHGALGRGHVGYDFGVVDNVPGLPHKFYPWGAAWFESFSLPKNVFVAIRSDIPKKTELMQSIVQPDSPLAQLLVLSQPTVDKYIWEISVSFALKNPHIKVIYKLHPGEISVWHHQQQCPPNMFVVNTGSLNKLSRVAQAVFGSYSTALAELTRQCLPICILDPKYGPDFYRNLALRDIATYVSSADELSRALRCPNQSRDIGFFDNISQ